MLPDISSCQTTYTSLAVAANCGLIELEFVVLLKLSSWLKVIPPSELFERNISNCPLISSCQAIYTLFWDTLIIALIEKSEELPNWITCPKVIPSSILIRFDICELPPFRLKSSHMLLTVSLDFIIWGDIS